MAIGAAMAETASYAGDIDPRAAWDMLSRDRSAVLIDVRTSAEWAYVGAADLSTLARKPLFVEWQSFPAMNRNENFAADLSARLTALGAGKDAPLLFLCRSGARSLSAACAMTAEGYARCYNVAGGFEGDRNGEGHRGSSNGWKAAGLPWLQS